jgi:hypothetical protein
MYNFSEAKQNLNELLADCQNKLKGITNESDLKMLVYTQK